MSVGYATLYGDMAGGFAAIKDVPKTLVYDLVAHRNNARGGDLIPAVSPGASALGRARPDQLDSDSLPPYELLDPILEAYVERDQGREEMIAARARRPTSSTRSCGWSTAPSTSAARRRRASGSRRKAFGRDRRLPITNRFGG